MSSVWIYWFKVHLLGLDFNTIHVDLSRIRSHHWPLIGGNLRVVPGPEARLNKHTGPGSQSRVPGPESLPGPRGIWTGLLTHSELSPHLQFSSHHLSSSRVHSIPNSTRASQKSSSAQFFMTMVSLRLLMPCLCVLSNLNLTFPHVPSPSPENKKTVGV